ncbi:hypothetical protein [Lysinibacillus sp. NPDC056232]|uniref:hypothetical protein n=1 Tax=Lysinibacillus sp. NPDC056232 TaxID=3345756 RepID=UPI0035DF1E7B
MRKIVFLITTLLIGTVFNFTPEAYAATQYHKDQNTTAYTGLTIGHGATYGYYNVQYNTVAVHKDFNKNPVIPFGTSITLDSSLYLVGPNINKSQFTVSDTGAGTGLSTYWIDVYYGLSNSVNDTNAKLFGNAKKVSYSATY